MKVVISGGTGYIGRHLSESLVSHGHEVVVLTRGRGDVLKPGVRAVSWDAKTPEGEWTSELSSANAVVNLAGASIGSGRWTRKRMAEILGSRLAATAAIVEAMRRAPRRPAVLVSASGIDYYGDRGDEPVTEESPAGDSFLARVSQQWEAAAEAAKPLGVRVVRLRTSLVFGRGAPAFELLTLPFRLFLGGPLGSGRQWFTWIHVSDHVGLYRLALDDASVSGPINAVAPDIRRQRDVAAEIGRVLHRPAFFPAPGPMLRLALGRQAELLLDGRQATPQKALGHGYRFLFGELPAALHDTLT
ncbi:MAG TPA: TIGR01777 family oxidoreductase [Candidatus Dormibacteraeota bacterium]|nr:TIGR01777 family oxidoreductase [Candidatus Dormibacteraeota bacterium]